MQTKCLYIGSRTSQITRTNLADMDAKDSIIQVKRLSQNVSYYNNVFKKLEKISSVIFYILSFKKDNKTESILVKSLEDKSFKLHEVSLKTLDDAEGETDNLYELQQVLLSVMSTLQVATAGRIIPEDMAMVIIEQIDAVQRYLANHYLGESGVSIDDLHEFAVEAPKPKPAPQAPTKKPTAAQPVRRAQRVNVPSGDISSDAYLVYSQLNDRTERIKTVLEAKPNATVKDIAEIITDVSEKTIQRDLNSLIEKGQVVREGERRWSKYSVVKDN